MDKQQTINQYVIANEKQLKKICFNLYRGNYLWEDLFQEFYLNIVRVSEETFKCYPIGKLCYLKILEVFMKRNRNKSALKSFNFEPIENARVGYQEDYVTDIKEYIEQELNKPHGFAPMLVFVQSMDESLRSIEKKTGVNINALSKYKKEGQMKLQRLLK